MSHLDHDGAHSAGKFLTRGRIAFAIFMAVALFFLLTEHRAHFFGALPFLLVFACPLMHLFHQGGHASHGHDRAKPARTIEET